MRRAAGARRISLSLRNRLVLVFSAITLAALEQCLPRWRDLGLDFVTMNEAVSTPAS